MVIYELGIKNNRTFNLSNIIEMDSKNSLRILDEFTSKFKDEKDLKEYLLDNNIINIKEYFQKLNILYKYDGYKKTLPVIYSNEKEYLNNLPMINIMYSLMCNEEFVEKLIKRYDHNSEYNPQRENINNLRLYLSDLKKDGEKALSYNSELIDHTITELIKLATNKKDKKNNSYKFNYRGYRDLALFLYNFQKIEQLNRVKEVISDTETLNKEKIEIKSEEISKGNDKWVLSSEGDPVFPFNSEEERMYKRQQEEELEEWYQRQQEEIKERYRRKK